MDRQLLGVLVNNQQRSTGPPVMHLDCDHTLYQRTTSISLYEEDIIPFQSSQKEKEETAKEQDELAIYAGNETQTPEHDRCTLEWMTTVIEV